MVDLSIKARWLVRTHHVMRVSSFATVFVATCIQLAGKGYGPGVWSFLVALLLVYPQAQYWRVLRTSQPISVVMNALVLDSFLLGIFSAAVGFSDWLTFSVVLGTLSNSAANKGWRSTGITLLALAAGALLAVAVGGFHFLTPTEWQSALLCMVGLGVYVLAVGNLAFSRNLQLRSTREQLRARERDLLEANATLRTSLTEIEALRKGLLEQANQDGLTKLFNRRFLDTTLERELARCKRESKPLALILLDIDHFKKYNDCYGHQAGDECLKAIASALQGSAKRAGDLAARYGGEEFSLVLPDTDGVDALRMAEELRQEIEAMAMPHAESDRGVVTISAGLAVMFEERHSSAEELLKAADEALYYAKWGGRNRVQVAPESSKRLRMDAQMPGGSLQLTWRRAYACGHAELDVQHEQLFRQINEVLLAITEGLPSDAVDALIDKLMRAVVVHFECEEALLTAIGFPDAEDHVAQHRALMSRAVDLVSQYRSGDLRMGDLLQFLAQDLIAKHMLKADRAYHDYLTP
jgi:diguanylate cyclase (GGDEF)-like protein/hemerythrin-like metal-binding protein